MSIATLDRSYARLFNCYARLPYVNARLRSIARLPLSIAIPSVCECERSIGAIAVNVHCYARSIATLDRYMCAHECSIATRLLESPLLSLSIAIWSYHTSVNIQGSSTIGMPPLQMLQRYCECDCSNIAVNVQSELSL